MKKIGLLLVSVATMLALTTAAYAEKTLRISLQLPLKHHLGQNLLDFKQEVEKESNSVISPKASFISTANEKVSPF